SEQTPSPHAKDSVPPAGGGAKQASSPRSPGTTPPGGGSAGRDDSGDRVEQDLDSLLADTQRERDEYLELAKRTKADFENFRKRIATDLQSAALRGKAEIARDVVPVLDDLERALRAVGLDPEGDSEDGLAHGVILVYRALRETLARHGIEPVNPKG